MNIHQYSNVGVCDTPMSPMTRASQSLPEHNASHHLYHPISQSLFNDKEPAHIQALLTKPIYDIKNRVKSVPPSSNPTRLVHYRQTTTISSPSSCYDDLIRSRSASITNTPRYSPGPRFNSDPSPRHGFYTQADLNVPVVAVDLADPSSVHDFPTCDDPEFIALCSSLESIRLVGSSSNYSNSCGSDPEDVLPLVQDHISTSVPVSLPVRSYKLPGPFTVVKELENGAFGQAVAVSELGEAMSREPRLLCLKVFKKEVVLHYDQLQGVKREFQAYRRLSEVQPIEGFMFLMRLDAALQDESYLYYAMDLMQSDLASAIDSEEHVGYAGRWIAQTASGLAALHALGIVHRDIKPDNLFIDCQFNIRIGDFGAAYTHEQPVSMKDFGPCVSTGLGTKGYLAPEMIFVGCDMYSCATDYWALGCVAFELLNKNWDVICLFQNINTLEVYDDFVMAYGPGFFLSAGISEEAEDLLYGLLEFEPEKRFGIAELRQHPYFDCEDGTNYFQDIEAKARNHPRLEIQYKDDSRRMKYPSILEPKILAPNNIPPVFDEFNWVNPSGTWGVA